MDSKAMLLLEEITKQNEHAQKLREETSRCVCVCVRVCVGVVWMCGQEITKQNEHAQKLREETSRCALCVCVCVCVRVRVRVCRCVGGFGQVKNALLRALTTSQRTRFG